MGTKLAETTVWIDRLRFSNGATGDLMLWLEPWAEEFTIPPRAELVLSADIDEPIDVEITGDGLVAYAGMGMRVRVEIGGVVHDSVSAELTVPDMGPLSTRGFIGTVFGDVPETRPGGMRALPSEPN